MLDDETDEAHQDRAAEEWVRGANGTAPTAATRAAAAVRQLHPDASMIPPQVVRVTMSTMEKRIPGDNRSGFTLG